MKVKGKIISLNHRADDGAGVVLDAKGEKTYAFLFSDIVDCRPDDLAPGLVISGDLGQNGILKDVRLEVKAKALATAKRAAAARG